ncbi:synaptotagmin-like protein 2 isoform X5 [Protopterus annectens]|uniref:synaptotagmin-like protein 2 isoform X5 n=1 Tax=Protopterus annectens TaxID=7888 RepID=UPI001CFB35AA|nr:synaptotagmin-like protein 2 isoform X5 [Protopterus annectens]
MIDLTFLTPEEQEAIMKVLQRDADLKRAEEERVRSLQVKVKDETALKNMTGEWFYEAKSKRHREKVHGSDIIRASMKKKKPLTLFEMTQSRMKDKPSWANSIDRDVFVPPQLFGLIEEPEEEQADESTTPSVQLSNSVLQKPEEKVKQPSTSPAKQRRNPFNDSSLLDDGFSLESAIELEKNETAPIHRNAPPKDKVSFPKGSSSDVYLQNNGYQDPQQDTGYASDKSQRSLDEVPMPKPRTRVYKQPDSLLDSDTSVSKSINKPELNGGTRRGILKRSSSSSSNDSEVLRFSNHQDSQSRNIRSSSTARDQTNERKHDTQVDDISQNSADKLKHVRFSPAVVQKEPLPIEENYSADTAEDYDILSSGFEIEQINKLDGFQKYRKDDRLLDKDNVLSDTSAQSSDYSNEALPKPQNDRDIKIPDLPHTTESPASIGKLPPQVNTYDSDLDPSGTTTGGFIENSRDMGLNEELTNKKNSEVLSPDTTSEKSSSGSYEDLNPVMEALRRSATRPSSKSLEDLSSIESSEQTVTIPREDLALSAEDEPSLPESQFNNPEKLKRLSKSVPAFLQEETDGRDTDSTSEGSYQLSKHKKTPSSLTNLSSSSGMASLSSVSGSVMSIYSGDFGNVDIKGTIQFTIDYVEQLKEFHIFIAQCRDLAAADVKKQRSDPYVKTYLLPDKAKMGKRKTSVKKKTLNPTYNEILRYKIDKETLLTQRLNVSVWHNDTFGRNSFLGEVDLDLATWNWVDQQMKWYPLKPRTPSAGVGLENRGEMKLALRYVPQPHQAGKKTPVTGEVHIWVKDCKNLPPLKSSGIDPFVKCSVLPDTSRKSRQKTRIVKKTTDPVFNHTMVYDGFRKEDLEEACVELTVWDHDRLVNHYLGGLRLGRGTGKSYGTPVDWMDSSPDEASLWERMMDSPNEWVEDVLPLKMLMMAKMTK